MSAIGNEPVPEPAIVDAPSGAITQAADTGMVERVARALYEREKLRKADMARIANKGGVGPWVALLLPYEDQSEIYRDLARAAIEAMREPTPAMMSEAMNVDGPLSRGHLTAVEIWQGMLDAALEAPSKP